MVRGRECGHPICEVGEHEGQHFFSMKLVEGGSLAGLDVAIKLWDGSRGR